MKILTLLFSIVLSTIGSTLSAQTSSREILNFDKNWKFQLDDIQEASSLGFDDSRWQLVDLPHDWSIFGPIDRDNPSGRGGAFFPDGIGWYRKNFQMPNADQGKRVFIDFDGVMANSEVWINGVHLGKRPFGYVSFRYELTPHLKFGAENVIAVRADNTDQPASRWYTGAGIYRHVRLVTTHAIHIDQWGVFVSTPDVSAKNASIKIQTKVINTSGSQKEIILLTEIVDSKGKILQKLETKQRVPAGGSFDIEQQANIKNPELWDIAQGNLYQALSKVMDGKTVIDQEITTFGVREFRFEPSTGFYINDRNIKIKGVCLHHDGGGLGAVVPMKVWERRLNLLRDLGVNAIRTSHHPFAPEFYELCDRMGFLVMDETFDTWTAPKNHAEYGYNLYFEDWWERDTRDVILRDRNYASIFSYSIGNEIRDNLDSPDGFKKYKDQQDLIHSLDPTRPVTMGLFRPNSQNVYDNGFVEMMDVVGQNYREEELVAAHKQNPARKVLGTENGHTRQAWLALRDNPFMAGQFLWTGIDYLGEADWPAIVHDFGLLDRIGGMKARALQRKSWWTDEPVVYAVRRETNAGGGELVPDWTPKDFDTYDVAHLEIYSNCEEVEVFLNGKSQGIQKVPNDASPVNYNLTFEKGILEVIGRNQGKQAAIHNLQTAGQPFAIKLVADQEEMNNDWDDVTHVMAYVVDENGVKCPNADNLIYYEISGSGKLLALDNGDRVDHSSSKGKRRRVYRGEGLAIIGAESGSGKTMLKAVSKGLHSDEVTIQVKEVKKSRNKI
ncbi:hypothetical protein P872_16980 [Rhodonellum psychrophilum GCM71 = DSM 17998]|uniref:Glycoside hydrolase family 2 n=2 Tax=Rhodonellum TaxID=336827 RepID=U5C4S9_9BACT|nr:MULTISPECIES: glycoside hydrolase family 2 TIM barrel-domain containing protein [Rhodonellum]ERM83217.1 hypothetical protein P872_16980 [Rhodonellum psychrophilum GCM71 = DSM 17998]SDZ14122.1 beta-galactosidase [Rhodonellum ikkaensis]